MYSYKDSKDIKQGSSRGVFGLNTGAFLTKFEFNPNAGTDGANINAIDITIKVEEGNYMLRLFEPTRVFKNNVEVTDKSSKEFKEGIEEQSILISATLTDIMKCFVDEETIKETLSTNISSFSEYVKIVEKIVKSNTNWEKTLLDVFLRYQYNIKGSNKRTFLELPKDVKQGMWITKSLGEGFKEDRTGTHLRYYRGEEEHPFKRNKWFVNNNFANQIVIEEDNEASDNMNSSSAGSSWV